MTELIQAVVVALEPIIAKLESGERVTLLEYVRAGMAIFALVSEYMSRKPVIGDAVSLVEGFGAVPDTAIETFGGEDQLADSVSRLHVAMGREPVGWRPDGHILKQLLPILIQLLPLII